eukprot:2910099-Prymnesium_polylepis.1
MAPLVAAGTDRTAAAARIVAQRQRRRRGRAEIIHAMRWGARWDRRQRAWWWCRRPSATKFDGQ